jgi:hypothetical protein
MRKTVVLWAAAALLSLSATRSSADVMDSVNEFAPPHATDQWGGYEVGWFYTPSSSYVLTGIETRFAGTDGRTCTLEFFQNGPPSVGGSVRLGSAAFATAATPTWSGVTFAGAIHLTAGSTYFVGLRNTQPVRGNPGVLGYNVTNQPGATALSYRFSWGSGLYEYSYNEAPWTQPILRFNGNGPDVVPEAGTLSALMGLLSGGALLILRRRR